MSKPAGVALKAAHVFSPSKEAAHAYAFRPHEAAEFAGVEISSIGTEKSFHAPPQIGTIPRPEPVTFGNDPVIAKRVQHAFLASILAARLAWHTGGILAEPLKITEDVACG
jgi:hypothetical protein